jgi:hypothetical protein
MVQVIEELCVFNLNINLIWEGGTHPAGLMNPYDHCARLDNVIKEVAVKLVACKSFGDVSPCRVFNL